LGPRADVRPSALYELVGRDVRDQIRGGAVAYGVAEGEADPDALAPGDPEPEGATDGDPDADDDGTTGTDGIGSGVGSGVNRDGISRKLRTKIATKIAMTAMIQGRARRSLRVGRAPR